MGWLVGCGSVSSPKVDAPAAQPKVTLAVRDAFVVVRRGGAAVDVTLDITREDGPTGPITIAALNPPAGLSASMVTVDEAAATATISITADGSAALGGPADVQLEGTFAAGTASAVLPAMVFDAPGTLDTTFGTDGSTIFPATTGGYDYPRALAVMDDGAIAVAGVTTTGGYKFVAAKLTADGTLDPSFGGGTGKTSITIGDEAQAYAVAVDADGRILVGGGSGAAAALRWTIVRLLPDGTLDPTFGNQTSLPGVMIISETASGGDEHISALHVLPSGAILAIGTAAASTGAGAGPTAGVGALRVSPDGTGPDPSFNGGLMQRHVVDAARHVIASTFPPVSVAVDSAGRYVIAGAVSTNASLPAEASFVGRLLETGAQDPQFTLRAVTTSAGMPSIYGVGVGPNDSVFLAGLVAPDDVLVLKYNSVGSLDSDFNGGLPLKLSGEGGASDVMSTSNGVVIAGRTSSPAPVDMLVMRLDAAGVVDSTFATDGAFTKHYSEGGGNSDLALRVIQDSYGRLVVGGRRVPTGGSRWNFVFFRLFP